MKKFENPIINVSLFDVENIVTNGSGIGPGEDQVETAVQKALKDANEQYTSKVLTVTF